MSAIYQWTPLIDGNERNDVEKPIRTLEVLPDIERSPKVNLEIDALSVNCISINKNGTVFASAGRDGIVRLFKFDFVSVSITYYDQVDITSKMSSDEPIEIERLKFCTNSDRTSRYLAICNDDDTCYIYDIKTNSISHVLFDPKNKDKFKFRDCVFILDKNTKYYEEIKIDNDNNNNNDDADENGGGGNQIPNQMSNDQAIRKEIVYFEYCIVGVNEKRNRNNPNPYSYLYQYLINNEFEKSRQCRLIRSIVRRMVCDNSTNTIITLHLDGTICISNALDLVMLNKVELTCDSKFFMDMALQPPSMVHNNGNKNNTINKKEKRCLIVVLSTSIVMKDIEIPNCNFLNSSSFNSNANESSNCLNRCLCCCGCFGCCCSPKAFKFFCTVFVVFVAMFMGIVLDQNPLQNHSLDSLFATNDQP